MDNTIRPVGLEQLTDNMQDICRSPHIYHLDEISLPCFFIETKESHSFIAEYIADRFISENVFQPKSRCRSAVFTLDDSRDFTLARLIHNIDSTALLNQPEGICIGIKIPVGVTINAKDSNLARFFQILASYKKVSWVFFTEDMDICDMRGMSDLIYSSFTSEIYPVCLAGYTPRQMAQAVADRLVQMQAIVDGRDKTMTALETMMSDCESLNQALSRVPDLLKSASYTRRSLLVSTHTIQTMTGGKVYG